MRDKRISLQDIASLADVTKMTVSRYLRDPNQVSEKNRQKLAKILEDIHYIPNRAPEILLGSKSRSIGIIIPSFKNHIFLEVLAGIESVASNHGYQTIITNYDYDKIIEEQKIINLLSYNIDALILMEKNHTKRAIKYLKSVNIPVAELMDISQQSLDIQVGFDNEMAGFDMTQALIKSGKKNIVYFNSIASARDMSRFEGYCRAMRDAGYEPKQMLPNMISSVNLGRSLFHKAIQEYPNIDGVFCTNDDIAVGVLLECQHYNIPVPEQIAIAGFHGLDIRLANQQQIASVITPRFDIGKMATELLLKRLNGEHVPLLTKLPYQIDSAMTV
ncbi:DNA-binding transcriptional regulator IdnR [Orbus mooreae]|uniref:DNA-binding transcriptional regulator IdnR n=1 Tax=Orbus mooreae TaxID=3074107 RepID=UPI00370D64EE